MLILLLIWQLADMQVTRSHRNFMLCLHFLQAAEQRSGSEASAVEWSTFEIAAEAAVAAERARRRAAGPGAKPPSRGPSPNSPFHPFAAVAAQNAAREAAAIVTLPVAKCERASPPPVANPFAAAAGLRGASPTLPSPLLVAEAGGFGSVAPSDMSDIPQVSFGLADAGMEDQGIDVIMSRTRKYWCMEILVMQLVT